MKLLYIYNVHVTLFNSIMQMAVAPYELILNFLQKGISGAML